VADFCRWALSIAAIPGETAEFNRDGLAGDLERVMSTLSRPSRPAAYWKSIAGEVSVLELGRSPLAEAPRLQSTEPLQLRYLQTLAASPVIRWRGAGRQHRFFLDTEAQNSLPSGIWGTVRWR